MTNPRFIGDLILVMGFHATPDLYADCLLHVTDAQAVRAACHAAAMLAKPAVYETAVGGWTVDYAGIRQAFYDITVQTLTPGDRQMVLSWLAQEYDGLSSGANPKAMWLDAVNWCARNHIDLELPEDQATATSGFCNRFHARRWDPIYAEKALAASEAPYDVNDMQLVERHNYHLSSEDDTVPMINGISLTLGVMRQWHILLAEYAATPAAQRAALRRIPEAWVIQVASATRLRASPRDYDMALLDMDRLTA
jgi:hypothetical protein